MHVYFSHSYRDVTINSYFLGQLVQESVPLVADQKSETWCVAKLERYLFESSGFISIIPKRVGKDGEASYSPYIGHELDLARRSRIPRLLFVDREVLQLNETRFPEDAIAFDAAEPQRDADMHRRAIEKFKGAASATMTPLLGLRKPNHATLVVDAGKALRGAAEEVAELLRRDGFVVTQLPLSRGYNALDNVRLLEDMWRSELCVFLYGPGLSETHVALAMAHAHSIPAVRLVFDGSAKEVAPTLTGSLHWSRQELMLAEFRNQLNSFRRGFVEPVAMARAASIEDVARTLGTTEWHPNADQLWPLDQGPALLRHVSTSDHMVQDEVARARKALRSNGSESGGAVRDFALCRALYDGFKRHKFAYEIEPNIGAGSGLQKIRTPSLIAQSSAATCIDLACFFAALLEAAGLNPVIVVLKTPSMQHAVVGYRTGQVFAAKPSLGDLRRDIGFGDILLFEATGAVEADSPVVPAEEGERRDKLLDFLAAKETAQRLLGQDVELVHYVDVRALRA